MGAARLPNRTLQADGPPSYARGYPQLNAQAVGQQRGVTTSLRDFERRLLEAAIEGDPEVAVLMAQIAAAQVTERACTGHGLYVHLIVPADQPRLRTERRDRQIEGAAHLYLAHPSLEHGAGTVVWVLDGRVDCIECFVYDGTWPADDTAFRILPEPPSEEEGGKSAW
jgi:hypothetical protein